MNDVLIVRMILNLQIDTIYFLDIVTLLPSFIQDHLIIFLET
jgi:hypothetical protein